MANAVVHRRPLCALAKAKTRERVLTAAKAAFEQKGYEDATIRLIARAAGLSTGAVFSSFTDKAALYHAVYGHAPISQEEARALKAQVEQLQAEIAQLRQGEAA